MTFRKVETCVETFRSEKISTKIVFTCVKSKLNELHKLFATMIMSCGIRKLVFQLKNFSNIN